MPEEFLHHIWENRLFIHENLRTTSGESLKILNVGKRNFDSGPDFFNAKIKLDNTIWAGNIEIHKKSSDWEKHNHQNDSAYDNVILHVVEIDDSAVVKIKNGFVPTLVFRYPEHFRKNYRELLEANTWIPCFKMFHKADPVILQLGYNRLMIERLENKTVEITDRLQKNNNDWNETFYQVLAKMFGFKVNALPFELLANSLPFTVLSKHKNNPGQLEALLYGNSGLLNNQLLGDDYYLELREEYSFLYKKYSLRGIESHLWKFMRLRPGNFPTVRISQLADLIYKSQGLFSKIIEIENINGLKELFKVKASSYWDSHYNFNKSSVKISTKELGSASVNILIINVVIPFLFVYGEKQNKPYLKNRALEFLEQLAPEQNAITKNWETLGLEVRNAFESQALLQLKNSYCEKKKCLYCQIGVKLVSVPEN